MTTIQEYRRTRATDVLDSISEDYPEKKLHIKPVKAISGQTTNINKPGINFALPEETG